MDESLTQQRRVEDEILRDVNSFREGRNARFMRELTVPPKEAPANSVPAAAVIRRVQALSGITRRKAYVGVSDSRLLKPPA